MKVIRIHKFAKNAFGKYFHLSALLNSSLAQRTRIFSEINIKVYSVL
jgi:hypothetical protein